MKNPLLNFDQLPFFSSIGAEHVLPALESILTDSRKIIQQLCEIKSPNWDNFANELENVDENINRVWSPVSHLNGVNDSDELRHVYQKGICLLTDYNSEVGQNQILYSQYQNLKNSDGFDQLSPARKRVIENSLIEFTLSGADLNSKDQIRLREINQELSSLSTQFEQNLLDATQAWKLNITNIESLAGLPQSAIDMARQSAKDENSEGWLFSLQIPSYLAVMQHAENTELRKDVYQAFTKRASELSDFDENNLAKFDNTPLIDNILNLRLEKATLLGFSSYAELSLFKKMAKTSEDVITFLTDLASHAKPVAEKELTELLAFTKKHYAVEKLEAWDISYYSERLREFSYNFSDEEVKPYFPVPFVMQGLFDICTQLFGVKLKNNIEMETWHEDVKCFDLITEESNEYIGSIYTDLYVRSNKRGGAWMDTCIDRRKNDGVVQSPVAFLNCNFSPPIGDDPALLSHNEVETLFHEFGHTLHHLLTEVDELSVSGISGVAWDAVELPSQFLENWCWQEESLELIAQHYQSKEKLPSGLLDKMRAAKNFQSGMQALRQIEFALFDMRIHSNQNRNGLNVQAELDQVRDDIALIKAPSYNRFQNSFAHIFSGGYAAGYYSYKWSEVLSADAFGRFEEEGIFNKQTGQDFLTSILQRGGVEDPNDLFFEFRQRPPKIDALLRHTGLNGL